MAVDERRRVQRRVRRKKYDSCDTPLPLSSRQYDATSEAVTVGGLQKMELAVAISANDRRCRGKRLRQRAVTPISRDHFVAPSIEEDKLAIRHLNFVRRENSVGRMPIGVRISRNRGQVDCVRARFVNGS